MPDVAVSGTGIGEQFIRHCVAFEVAARVRVDSQRDSQRDSECLARACRGVVGSILNKGDGGVIAVDKQGCIALEFNTKGMYRGAANNDGRFEVMIF